MHFIYIHIYFIQIYLFNYICIYIYTHTYIYAHRVYMHYVCTYSLCAYRYICVKLDLCVNYYIDISWSFKVFSNILCHFLFIKVCEKEEIMVQKVKLNVLSTITEQNPDESLVSWLFSQCCHTCLIGFTPAESEKDNSPHFNILESMCLNKRSF